VRAVIRGRPFCPLISESDGQPQPVRMRLVLEPRDATAEVPVHTLPITAVLRYPRVEPIALEIAAGETRTTAVRVPGPIAPTEVAIAVEGIAGDVRIEPVAPAAEVHADSQGWVQISLRAFADDCCGAGTREGRLALSAGGSTLRVPLRMVVQRATFWTCPGKQIAMAIAALLGLGLLAWFVHGWVTPARFDPGAVLLSASSLEELIALREGDDGFRLLRRFPQTHRGFRRPAAVWLGGPRAPLPSLRQLPPDGRIEAQPGGARLIVNGPGVLRWDESEGKFVELGPGTYPVPRRLRLQRGDKLFLELRR
jgi:hypothetical protein